jgi:hypothetical protein
MLPPTTWMNRGELVAYDGFLWALDQTLVDRLTASEEELIATVQAELYEQYYLKS